MNAYLTTLKSQLDQIARIVELKDLKAEVRIHMPSYTGDEISLHVQGRDPALQEGTEIYEKWMRSKIFSGTFDDLQRLIGDGLAWASELHGPERRQTEVAIKALARTKDMLSGTGAVFELVRHHLDSEINRLSRNVLTDSRGES